MVQYPPALVNPALLGSLAARLRSSRPSVVALVVSVVVSVAVAVITPMIIVVAGTETAVIVAAHHPAIMITTTEQAPQIAPVAPIHVIAIGARAGIMQTRAGQPRRTDQPAARIPGAVAIVVTAGA